MFDNPVYIFIIVLILGYVAEFILSSKKRKAIKKEHEFFEDLLLWPQGSPACWQARVKYGQGTIGVYTEDDGPIKGYREPTASEEAFCKNTLAKPSEVYKRALPAIHEAWESLGNETALPENWQDEFTLDGFSVPVDCNTSTYWGVSYSSKSAKHYISIGFHKGVPVLESVDEWEE